MSDIEDLYSTIDINQKSMVAIACDMNKRINILENEIIELREEIKNIKRIQ